MDWRDKLSGLKADLPEGEELPEIKVPESNKKQKECAGVAGHGINRIKNRLNKKSYSDYLGYASVFLAKFFVTLQNNRRKGRYGEISIPELNA